MVVTSSYSSFLESFQTLALVCPVPKKGDLSRIENYRPISITETSRKLFELCILLHLQILIPSVFVQKDQPFIRSRHWMHWQNTWNNRPVDSRNWHFWTSRLHTTLFPVPSYGGAVLRLYIPCLWSTPYVSSLIITVVSQLVLKHRRSQPFAQPAGVLQGSILSHLLYSIRWCPHSDQDQW